MGPTKKRVTSRPAKGKDVYLQGSRQMDSLTRQYYERNLGAGMFVSPETENGLVGYSEPLRRFIQHEGFTPQVNEIAFERSIMSWDLNFGGTKDGESDYVVGLIVKTRGAKRFLVDRYKSRADFTETIRAMKEMISRYPECSAKYVEKAANGAASMSLLESTYGVTGLIPIVKDKNKLLYADAANDQLRAGNWYLPHPAIASWVDDFLYTLQMFPRGKHDDDVDAWSQAAIKLQSGSRLDLFLTEVDVFPGIGSPWGAYNDDEFLN